MADCCLGGAQTTRIKVNNDATGVPVRCHVTLRLPIPFMALCRASASALGFKLGVGFTLPLLACEGSGAGRVGLLHRL